MFPVYHIVKNFLIKLGSFLSYPRTPHYLPYILYDPFVMGSSFLSYLGQVRQARSPTCSLISLSLGFYSREFVSALSTISISHIQFSMSTRIFEIGELFYKCLILLSFHRIINTLYIRRAESFFVLSI